MKSTDHHMKTWPTNIRFDRGGLVERICPHGIGHPDPDSLRQMKNDNGTHGCDRCCLLPEKK